MNFFFILRFVTFVTLFGRIEGGDDPSEVTEGDVIVIDPHVYREPGCPLVPEIRDFNRSALATHWYFVYGSIAYFADLAHAVLGRSPTAFDLRHLCPSVTLWSFTPKADKNTTLTLEWTFPRHRRAPMYLDCWPQSRKTNSKFECYFAEEKIHTYVMMAATDYTSWMLFVRCKIGVVDGQPGEGMTWALLSAKKTIDPDVAQVAFGYLAGFGFDLLSYKFHLDYDHC